MSFVTVSMKPASTHGTFNGNMRREIERLLQDVSPVQTKTSGEFAGDAHEDAKGFTLDFDVPGFAPDQLEVMAEDGALLIRGTRPARELTGESRVLFAERATGTFERRLRLPKTADMASLAANYAHGVLTVRVEKLASVTPRRVVINVGGSVRDVASPTKN